VQAAVVGFYRMCTQLLCSTRLGTSQQSYWSKRWCWYHIAIS